VVPAHNEQGYIAACLRSLARQDIDQPYEVVLVDNNCTDQTVPVALQASPALASSLRVVDERRPGRGAARFAGFAAARGPVMLSADADTVYARDWIRTLLDALAEPDVVAVTTTARIADLPAWQNCLVNIGQPLAMWCYRLVLGHHCLSGFSFAIRREVYDVCGGFNPELTADEDADLSRRVARLGKIRLVYAPVTMSGRRFRKNLVRGAWAYVRLFWRYRFNPKTARLDDVR
ncbi:MAG TPA: glycosyltransferase, partial [Chloroflexota bacterium]